MENIKPYTKYKPSGITWLRDIPEHWKVESFKNILTERNEKNNPIRTKEILSLSIDKGVTLYAEKTTNLDRFKDDFTQYKLAHKDDLVFNSMNMIVGAVGVSNYFGCVSPIYYTYHGGYNQPNSTKFYEYLFRNKIVQSFLYSLGKGLMAIDRGDGKYNTLRLKISRDDLRSLKLPFPNPFEQIAVANFLDYKTAKIDRFIRKKKQLIKLLNEQKAGMINDAITKGLEANAKMKPSGIEWSGDIPKHWEVRKLKRITIEHRQGYYDAAGYVDSGIRLARITDITDEGFLDYSDMPLVKWTKESDNYLIKKGDFLFARTGGAGRVALVEEDIEAVFASYLIRFRFDSSIDNKFLKYYFFSRLFLNGIANDVHGGVNQNVHAVNIKNQFIAFPSSKSEQYKIVYHIEKEAAIINTAIATIEKEIALVQEYRTALVAEAVTGKIDVRDYKVPVLEEEDLVYEEVEEKMDMVAEDGEGMKIE